MSDAASGKAALFFQSPGGKFFVLGILVLILLIPQAMVGGIISERELRSQQTIYEVSDSWGGTQMLFGPVLVIPYDIVTIQRAFNGTDQVITESHHIFVLPEGFDLSADMTSETLHRSIYDVPVYETDILLRGSFTFEPDVIDIDENAKLRPDRAYLVMGISGMKGIKGTPTVNWAGEEQNVEPGALALPAFGTGLHARIPLKPEADKSWDFAVGLRLNGAQEFSFVPVGRSSHARISADWADPSFAGTFLPDEREITETGFRANWTIPHLARSIPQIWKDRKEVIIDSYSNMATVRFVVPVDFYDQSHRAAKYGILFVGLTFLVFFLFEIIFKLNLHAAHYVMIGLALSLFYLLLLSFSEHVGFFAGYLIGAAGIIGMVFFFAASILKSWSRAGIILVFLAFLYALLYVLLKLEGYSLMLGSVALFIALAGLMFSTRKIDWRDQVKSLNQDVRRPG